jgi:hypothetical protein
MMGNKKLSDIKAEIRAAFAKEGIDVETWLDLQMAKLQRGPSPNADALKSLRMIRNGLKRAVASRQRKRSRSRTQRSKS